MPSRRHNQSSLQGLSPWPAFPILLASLRILASRKRNISPVGRQMGPSGQEYHRADSISWPLRALSSCHLCGWDAVARVVVGFRRWIVCDTSCCPTARPPKAHTTGAEVPRQDAKALRVDATFATTSTTNSWHSEESLRRAAAAAAPSHCLSQIQL